MGKRVKKYITQGSPGIDNFLSNLGRRGFSVENLLAEELKNFAKSEGLSR